MTKCLKLLLVFVLYSRVRNVSLLRQIWKGVVVEGWRGGGGEGGGEKVGGTLISRSTMYSRNEADICFVCLFNISLSHVQNSYWKSLTDVSSCLHLCDRAPELNYWGSSNGMSGREGGNPYTLISRSTMYSRNDADFCFVCLFNISLSHVQNSYRKSLTHVSLCDRVPELKSYGSPNAGWKAGICCLLEFLSQIL